MSAAPTPRRLSTLVCLVFAGLGALSAYAEALPAQEAAQPGSPPVVLPVESFRLDNGLTVVLSEDHSSPVVAVSVWYHVGRAHEFEGRAGLAQLTRHLLGRRVRGLDESETNRLLASAGGVASAETDMDRTAYEMLVPSGALELALWMQADRLGALRLDPALLGSVAVAAAEETRVEVEGQPYAHSQIVVDTLVSPYGPYRAWTRGGVDLTDVDVALVERFHDAYYVASNAVLTIVGDTSREQVDELVQRHFGSLARRPVPPRLPPFPALLLEGAERRATLTDPAALAPLLWVAYSVPEAVDEDLYALSLLTSVIGAGPSRRLQQTLVGRTRTASGVVSVLNRRRGPGSLLLGALPTDGTDPERLERVLLSVVDSLQAGGVTPEELEIAKTQRRASEVAARLTLAGRAAELQRNQLYWGRAVQANSEMDRYEAVTPSDVLRVARRYLVPENRAVVLALPAGLGG